MLSMCTHQHGRLALFAAADVVLELLAELGDSILHWPAGSVRQSTDRRTRHDADRLADLVQDLEVFHPALAAADTVGDLQHPAGPLAARSTLATRLVREESASVVQDIHDAGHLVE